MRVFTKVVWQYEIMLSFSFLFFEFHLGVHANYNQGLGIACAIMAHISPDSVINDCSNMDVRTMTLIDVTFPMMLLTHS